MKYLLPIACIVTLVSLSRGADLEEKPTVIKMVTRLTSDAMKNDPSATRLKTLYRAGKKYSRLEEEADTERGMHRLIVTNEPDSWVINLENQTGNHYLDKGPKFDTILPIFWGSDGRPEPDFAALEFGEELQYFSKERARESGTREIEGRKCKALSIKSGDNEATLYLDEKSERPFQVDLSKYGRVVASVRYLEYEPNLPFDQALFDPPKDVMIMPADID